MKTLFLDFASHQKIIALIDGDVVAGLRSLDDRIDESTVMSKLELLMSSTNEQRVTSNEQVSMTPSFQSIDRLAATVGPGGFMSLRVGISIANALAWSMKIPLAGIHLSDLWHARTCQPIANNYLWIHSTKKELFFIRGFGDYADSFPEPVLITLADLQLFTSKYENTPFVGEILDDQLALLPHLTTIKKVISYDEMLSSYLATLTYDQVSLSPWYGRGA